MRAEIVKKMVAKLTTQILNEFLEDAAITAENLVETCKKDSLNKDLAYQIADCCYKLGMFKNCVAILEQIRPIDDRKVPKVMNLKGMAYQRMGNFEYANELYELSLIEQPDHVNSLNNMGNLCMRKKLYEKAKLYYTKSKKSSVFCDAAAKRLNNKAVACYNLAIVAIHTDDMIGLLYELLELEQFLTPEMYVYKNIMETGLDSFLFKGNTLQYLIVLEEVMYSILVGQPPSWSKKGAASNTTGMRRFDADTVSTNPKIIQLEQYMASKPANPQSANEVAKPEHAKKPPSLALGQVSPESNALMSTDRRQPVVIKMRPVNPSVPSEDEIAQMTNKAGSVNFNLPSTMNTTNRDARSSIQRTNQAGAPNTVTAALSASKSQPSPARPILTLSQHPLESFVRFLLM